MCRASIANSDDPTRVGATLNVAILALLIPTLALIGALVALVLRYYRADLGPDPDSSGSGIASGAKESTAGTGSEATGDNIDWASDA